MIDPGLTIASARLQWLGDQPSSVEFGDIYHAADGVAEVLRVFADPIGFDERCAAAGSAPFAIGEVGFGSGLNFVTFAQRFLDRAPIGARLHFVSFEARPIAGADFVRLALRRGQPLYRELARVYPPLLPGWHRRTLGDKRIRLSVYFGDVAEGLADLGGRLPAPMSAWLLDGFDPRRNPACWSAEVLRGVAALSGTGAAIATFTASGAVRRGLTEAGFAMRRIDQRPHKHHTLAGTFTGAGAAARPRARHVAVIGAGLAGVCTSYVLAAAGIRTTLIERDPEAALGLPGTVLHTRLRTDAMPASRMRRTAYFFAGDFYRQLQLRPSGALQFAGANLDQARMEAIAAAFAASGPWLQPVDAATASSIAGVPLREAGLYFGDSYVVDGATVATRINSPACLDRVHGALAAIEHTPNGLHLAIVRATTRAMLEVDAVVLCTGCPPPIAQAATLEVLPVAGQMEIASIAPRPSVPIFSQGYLCPLGDGQFALGATYEQAPWTAARATTFNLERAAAWWRRASVGGLSVTRTGSVRGVRGVSSDRLPLIGALTGVDQAGIYLNLAHGSNGTATAPLGAAMIAELLGGEFAPITRPEFDAVAPARFVARQARRGLRHGAHQGDPLTRRTPTR